MSNLEQATLAAQEMFNRGDFRRLITDLIKIPSPTGEEMAIARYCADFLGAQGLSARVQPLSDTQANAIGRYAARSDRDGPELLLYANLDTHMGAGSEDEPWAGDPYPDILKAEATWDGDEVSGLCAENPKGYAAAVMMAASCIAKAGIPLRGDLTVGLGAGGMTVLHRPGWSNRYIGAGNGAIFMLQRAVTPDYCIVCKPTYAVSWEEVGVCFYRIRLKSGIGYPGIRHLLPRDLNPIPQAALVIQAIEAWLPGYAKRHTSGLVEPWGAVTAIHGGWEAKPLFTPAIVDLIVDLRCAPDVKPADVTREFRAMLKSLEPSLAGIELEIHLELAIPGGRTAPDSWIIRSMIDAWEAQERRPHEPVTRTSGYTDISVLRQWGIPTGRIGVPLRTREPDPMDTLPMNRLHLDDAERLVKLLIRTAVDTCSRSLEETRG